MAAGVYDPRTCITARELRECGIPVPESIPGVAWIARSAIRLTLAPGGQENPDGGFTLNLNVNFNAPLEWIQIDWVIEPGDPPTPPP